jgi:hypothetical protein
MSAGSQPRFTPVHIVAKARPKSFSGVPTPWMPGPTGDPYLAWALHTGWRGFAMLRHRRAVEAGSPAPQSPRLKMLLALNGDAKALKSGLQALRQVAGVKIPTLYDTPVAGSVRMHYLTAEMPLSSFDAFMHAADRLKCVVSLATPLRDQGSPWPGDGKARAGRQARLGGPDLTPLLDGLDPDDHKVGLVTGGAIGVFDYGCPFLRTEWDAGSEGPSRIAALWHQECESESVPSPWTAPESTGYGRVLAGSAITKIQEQVREESQEVTEARAYASLRYLIDLDDPRRRVHMATHGAHVLHVAAGTPDPLAREFPVAARDHAAKAAVLFVQLPEATAGDSSGASLGAFLLDGLRYMMALTVPKQPLVVNVSYGGTAGPHDGSSLIERAMDQLLEARPRMQIVIAAGNARRLGLHARRVATASTTALFRIDIAPGDRTDTFIEFWYPKRGPKPEFRVRLPDGDWSGWIGQNGEVLLNDPAGDPMAAFIHRRQVPDGGRSMALLAIGPTEAPDDDDGPLAPAGLWEVEVRLPDGAAADVPIQAWIKRDDARPFSGRVQSCFIGLEPEDTEDTLSSLSCGQHTIVVSGFRWSDGMVADYSSTGPRAGPQWPLVYGLCERDSVDPGIRAAAVRSGETLVMNGTSVAAPVVARQVYNLMKADGIRDRQTLKDRLRELSKQRGSRIRMDPDR